MQTKSLQTKRALRAALLVLLLSAVGMGKTMAQNYDFSAVCSTGQTLYYRYIEATNDVQLVPPNYFPEEIWDGYDKPTGDLLIPESVNYNGITYSVTTIGRFCFRNCRDLISVTIPNSVSTIEYGAFSGCSGLTSVTIPNSVTTIDGAAFSGCSGLTSITIPNSVTTIGESAFASCSGLTSITIPNSVISLGQRVFYETGWYVQQPNGILYLDNCCLGYKGGMPIGELCLQEGTRLICDGAFYYCIGFTGSLTIPNSVTCIGERAFQNCTGFTGSLNIPNSVTTIGRSAFQDCSGLTGSLTIGNSVTTIGESAFQDCSGFTGNLTIPNSVTYIGESAFQDCSGFTGNLTIPNSVTYIGERAFQNCNGFMGSLIIPNSLSLIDMCAFDGCSGLMGNLIIPNSVTSIGDGAFRGCSGFTGNLVIPYQMVEIGDSAFSGCSGFSGNLTIPNSVKYISRDAFDNCTGLNEIFFDAKECEVDGTICHGCTGVTSIAIGDSVEIITERLFSGFENLTTVSIGKTVKIIESRAFAENPRLNMIYYNVEKDLEAATNVFDNCPNLTTIHIGPDVKEIGSEIFNGCNTVHFVVALGPTPAVLDAGAFSDIVDNSVLMVSCGKRVTYYSVWNMFPFNNIIEDCDTYGINVGAVDDGGTITPSVTEAQMGQEVQITITPNPGMALVSIKVVNANDPTQIIPISPSGKAASTYSFTMPPFEVVVMATFKNSGASVDENNSVEVAVYPNPTNGLVKIEAESIKHVSISNMLGQVVFNGKVDGGVFEYDFSGQKAGIYLVRIETTSGVAVKKISVTR